MWILRLRTFFFMVVRAFQFFRKRRERQAEVLALQALERREEREHQQQMLETFFTKLVEFTKVNQEGILKLAEAQAAQAEVLSQWLKGFTINDPSPAMPQIAPSALDEEFEEANPLSIPGLPPEFSLAYTLQQSSPLGGEPDYDREGRDTDISPL